MKNILRSLFVISLLLTAAWAQSQSPRQFIDQMQPVIDTTAGSLAIGGASQEKLAQTVTVGLNATLHGLYLPIGCDTGRLIVEIRNVESNGAPGTVVFGHQGFLAEDVPSIGPLFRYFRLGDDPGLTFTAGSRFAIVLRNPTGSCGIFRGPTGDSYSQGDGFFDARPNPPGWVPFSMTEARLDLPFMTVMRLP